MAGRKWRSISWGPTPANRRPAPLDSSWRSCPFSVRPSTRCYTEIAPHVTAPVGAYTTADRLNTLTDSKVNTVAQAPSTTMLKVASAVGLLMPQMSCKPTACLSSRP